MPEIYGVNEQDLGDSLTKFEEGRKKLEAGNVEEGLNDIRIALQLHETGLPIEAVREHRDAFFALIKGEPTPNILSEIMHKADVFVESSRAAVPSLQAADAAAAHGIQQGAYGVYTAGSRNK